MKKILLFLLGAILSLCLTSLQAQVRFEHTYRPSPITEFQGSDVIQNSDNGYTLAYWDQFNYGYPKARDIAGLIRTDERGRMLWASHYSSDTYDRTHRDYYSNEGAQVIHRHAEDGYIMALYYTTIMSTDLDGVPQWSYTYSGGDLGNIIWKRIQQTQDGNYIALGNGSGGTGSQRFQIVMKIDGNGRIIWSRKLEPKLLNSRIVPHNLLQDRFGNIHVIGTLSPDKITLWKLNSAGTSQWVKSYSVASFTPVQFGAPNILRLRNNEYIIAAGATISVDGDYNPFGREENLMQIHLDINGNINSTRIDTLLPSESGFQYDIQEMYENPDGSLTMVDWMSDFENGSGDFSGSVIHVSNKGKPIYASRLSVPLYAATQTSDGMLALVGTELDGEPINDPPITLLKTDMDGFTGCNDNTERFAFKSWESLSQRNIRYSIVSRAPRIKGTRVFFKYQRFTETVPCFQRSFGKQKFENKREGALTSFESPVLYPNPSSQQVVLDLKEFKSGNSTLPVKMQIMDTRGKLIQEKELNPTTSVEKLSFDQAGIYLIRLSSGERVWTEKISIVK